jgi:hypothetical protein
VASAFAAVLRAPELTALASFEREVAAELAAFEQRRLDNGAGTLIDLNVTRAAEGRAARRVALASGEEAAARASLAEVVALPVAELPAAAGALPDAWPAPAALVELERLALDRRSDLLALRSEVEAATARIRLERSLATPNLVIGVAKGREADREDLDTLRAGFTIPLFQRNQGGIATARAEEGVLSAQLASAELPCGAKSSPRGARQRRLPARRGLSPDGRRKLEENLDLSSEALRPESARQRSAGLRRELIDSRRELIEAAADVPGWRRSSSVSPPARPPSPDFDLPRSSEISPMTFSTRRNVSRSLLLGLALVACSKPGPSPARQLPEKRSPKTITRPRRLLTRRRATIRRGTRKAKPSSCRPRPWPQPASSPLRRYLGGSAPSSRQPAP